MKRAKKPFDLSIEELAEVGRLAAAEAVLIAKSKGVRVSGKRVEAIGVAKSEAILPREVPALVKTG